MKKASLAIPRKGAKPLRFVSLVLQWNIFKKEALPSQRPAHLYEPEENNMVIAV